MKAQRKKPNLLLVSRMVGWAYDNRCISLEHQLKDFYNVQRQMGLNTQAEIVYFPGAEMLRRGLPFKKDVKVCVTIGGLSCFTEDDLMPSINEKATAFSIPNMLWYDSIKAKAKKKLFYIPNGVNTTAFTPGNRINAKEFIVGWVGNDKPARMAVKRVNVLRDTCQSLGIRLVERNWNHNHINHSDMPSFYKGIDLYVNCSTTEGSNNPILEACSAGVPVLGTPVGNIPELLSSGAMLLSENLSDLKDKIKFFRDIGAVERRLLGTRLRSRMVQEFDWSLIANRYKEMFDFCYGTLSKTAVNDHYVSRATYHQAPKTNPVPVHTPTKLVTPVKPARKTRLTLTQRRRQRALLAQKKVIENPKGVLISVVMTCYNQGTFIEDAIKSVVSQTHSKWEIIIVDDCSVDNSISMIQRCIKTYKINDKVKVFTQKENGGYGKSLRDAIKRASGELIAVLDSDDALADKDALKLCAQVHEKHPEASLTYSNYQRCDKLLVPNQVFKTRQIGDNETLLPSSYSLKLVPEVSHLKVFKKACYDITVGIDPELPQTVDKDLILKLEEVGKLVHIDKELLLYRKHDQSLASSLRKKSQDYQDFVSKMRRRIYDSAVERRENTPTLISVAMTCYNQGHLIKDALDSVVMQNYPNWELVIVDDCSTDNSIEVIDRFIKDHSVQSKVKVIQRKENGGYGACLKDAIEKSTGELVAILDSDDALCNNKVFSVCIRHHQDTNIVLTYSNYIKCDKLLSPLRLIKTRQKRKTETLLKNGTVSFKGLRISHLKVFKRKFYNLTDGVNPLLRKAVDKDLVLKLEEIGDFKFINLPLIFYRRHDQSLAALLKKESTEYRKKIAKMKADIFTTAVNRRLKDKNEYLS